jgi:prenyl protein peptidase
MTDMREKGNYRGYKNFAHYCWAAFVFKVFGLWESKETDWVGLKQVVIAPILEEFTYRGLIYGMFRDSGTYHRHPIACLVLLPLFFAFAHVHIMWRKRNEMSLDEFKRELVIKLFQVFYTQIFGMYSAWIYCKTDCLWAAIALHSHCNYFGFPNFGICLN